MKFCSKCGNETTGHSWCKPCRKEYDRAYWAANKEKRLEQKKRNKENFNIWYKDLKSKPCTDCGKMYPHYVMQWDHLPQYEKTYVIAELARIHCKLKIKKEIEKCELVCANCHAIRTHTRKHNGV